ncbi:MAG: hypothetical protein A3B74_02020 [Candidatus Kerfeldbacteria bacterium RIFCSPHIGHO2_02_FULL_42_14]|uniref:RNHCP domain-containing protein n=1 Tax=Candidatus Kerfeldbacteria bacterium RIFCSPHIGHO2_02_FULL_42_14 TaxID=1798540 RepID=A0A1G2ANH2_9BACT|nr:MAG: hypothetical protein A3B74_02020 [Candidatus Kerfeldbacteria bacterium RIFCSPHIGHO2_02_FULL_42_14]OGY81795.1 MAG: hypothetical protein A3E60_00595 [Candidatus Kerfeldbacteria bacterium RIFCSPHIGHO2_12_FULL_42_13]OGY84484.1 MAG: hypothetical protein A3I91_00210 [Candidatus Kerfeldbacteria bacterium RIFCSPLOWO2_02_FULL_42_19]OGY87976.1 MAG: hypothetical protein A3G01_04120 [Candidatus Kerfeldbacteria bacterium RIFCSPLOWO2_12_FULL_43_9]
MKRFQRRKEDFVCEYCHTVVIGDGYTNHCPQCLVSKHVDIFPGDRAANCGGRMNVAAIDFQDGEYILIHECVRCRHRKNNKVSPRDSFHTLFALIQERNS